MRAFTAFRAAVAACALLGAWALSGCGGSGEPVADATTTIDDASSREQAQAYTVLPDELVHNGLFTQGLTDWVVGDAGLVNSELRAGAKALNVGWRAYQTFAPTALAARKSYTLFVTARNDRAGGSVQLAVRFHRPTGAEVFRTYATTVGSTAYKVYQIDFTAPEYTAMADVIFTGNGSARLIVDSVSLKMRASIAQTEPIASSAGSYVPPGYVLAFNDEFNGTALNRSKWFTRMIYAAQTQDRLNDEQQRYRDNDNHRVANGELSLVARKVSSTDPNGVNYESGMIRSDWTARHGYYEARVKMPGGRGVWPAFWLNSDVSALGRLSWPPEIDIFEFVNNGVEDRVNMLHSGVKSSPGFTSVLSYADPAFDPTWTFYRAPFDFDKGWHTVGVEWDAAGVSMFLDGRRIYTRSHAWAYGDGTPAGPAHILLNLAIGGAWAGRHGIDDSAFPQALQIDWVRAYQKAN